MLNSIFCHDHHEKEERQLQLQKYHCMYTVLKTSPGHLSALLMEQAWSTAGRLFKRHLQTLQNLMIISLKRRCRNSQN